LLELLLDSFRRSGTLSGSSNSVLLAKPLCERRRASDSIMESPESVSEVNDLPFCKFVWNVGFNILPKDHWELKYDLPFPSISARPGLAKTLALSSSTPPFLYTRS
jgi:hypothetical protein